LAPGTVARFDPLCRSGPAFLAHMLAFVIAKTSKQSASPAISVRRGSGTSLSLG